jgi:drug/metabolite transporter (DMT)-like permease
MAAPRPAHPGFAQSGLAATLWGGAALPLTLAALMFGGNALLGRLAVGQISPMVLVCLRWALVSAPLAILVKNDLRRDFPVLRKRWLFVAATGTFGFTTFNVLFYTAAHSTTAVNIAILQGIVPAIALIGARIMFGTKVRALQGFGAALTMVGVVVIAVHGEWARLVGFTFNPGDVMVIIACVLYGGYTLALRRRPDVASLSLFAAMAAAAFVASLPLAGYEILAGQAFWPTPRGWAVLAAVALFPSLLAQIFYIRGVQLIGPARAGVYVNLAPVFGALLAIALLGEAFAPYHAVGLILVVGGVMIAEWSAKWRTSA